MVLILDDALERSNKLTSFAISRWNEVPLWFASSNSFMEYLKQDVNRFYKAFMLDHDLGLDEPTGLDVVKFIIENNIKVEEIVVHSVNPEGSKRMVELLTEHGYKALKIMPF